MRQAHTSPLSCLLTLGDRCRGTGACPCPQARTHTRTHPPRRRHSPGHGERTRRPPERPRAAPPHRHVDVGQLGARSPEPAQRPHSARAAGPSEAGRGGLRGRGRLRTKINEARPGASESAQRPIHLHCLGGGCKGSGVLLAWGADDERRIAPSEAGLLITPSGWISPPGPRGDPNWEVGTQQQRGSRAGAEPRAQFLPCP